MTTSPVWKHTVLVINFDEWGGFFEHVAPGVAPDVDPRFQQRGFRVPCLVISPFARRAAIATGVYDHTSVLKMIEWQWNLPALSVRDANANNLAEVLDFGKANLSAPAYSVPDSSRCFSPRRTFSTARSLPDSAACSRAVWSLMTSSLRYSWSQMRSMIG